MNMARTVVDSKPTGLDQFGRRYFKREVIGLILQAAVLFIAAGRFDLPRGWIFFCLVGVGKFGSLAGLSRLNPDLINHRGRFIKPDTQPFDRLFFALFLPLIFVMAAVAGLDAGRFHWTPAPAWFFPAGLLILLTCYILSLWAMATNPHFETTVRLQQDRGQTVCTSGPYRFIRHPGYLAVILFALSEPMVLGSYSAFIPAAMIIGLIFVRTVLEDRMLQEQLPGYRDYAARTGSRLIPGIW